LTGPDYQIGRDEKVTFRGRLAGKQRNEERPEENMLLADILIIDDEPSFCGLLSRAFGEIANASSCPTLQEGLREASRHPYDVILLDVHLPDGNGLGAIQAFKELRGAPEVIVITGACDPKGAETSIRAGAWDYLEKPASIKDITRPVKRALEYRKQKSTLCRSVPFDRKRIIGSGRAISKCIDLLSQASKSDLNVLLTGETGTGKELFARTLFENSDRADQPFVVVDCGALPESLVESLLFGHERGAFTGAERSKTGLIKQADGGTLFLDEIAELPLSLQKAFLRVLQEKRFRPIGSQKELTSDFRVVAATNRNLDKMVESGFFRDDLLYRISPFAVELPPLRERVEDIRELALRTVTRACEKSRIGMKSFSPDFFDILQTYNWPGNVRELMGTLQRSLAVAVREPVLYPAHLPVDLRVKASRLAIAGRAAAQNKFDIAVNDVLAVDEVPLDFKDFRNTVLEGAEKRYFTQLVRLANGSSAQACRLSDISRSRLFHFLHKYNISLCNMDA
jgi:two-component system NtrC family response regulator